MTTLTKKAIKGIKFYKHIVQSMEKFIQKCRPEYKVPGLYVIDSVVRQSRHQFGQEKDVFMPRLCKNIINTFKHLYKCPQEEKQRIIRVLYLWQKNSVFPPEIVQQLLAMGGETSTSQPPTESEEAATTTTTEQSSSDAQIPAQPDAGALTSMLAQLLANPNNPQIQQLTGLLSSSQQAQLQTFVTQVKGQQENEEIKTEVVEIEPEPPSSSSVFQPLQNNSQPPFLQSENEVETKSARTQPSFNRAILDYDYSDDESPKSQPEPKHKPGIDMELLAKLPTVDQLKQLSSLPSDQMANGNRYSDANSSQQFHSIANEAAYAARDIDDRMRKHPVEHEEFGKERSLHESERAHDDRSRSTSQRRRSRERKRSRSRSRDRHRHRRRSRSRDRHRSKRSRSQERHRSHHRHSKERNEEREKELEREINGLPPLREGCISLCSKTVWIGNLASKVSQQEIKTEVENYGPIESINMIPPRGCAYICMDTRQDAAKALQRLKHQKIGGKALKVDWAPGKEVKPEYKEFWSKEHGVNYIPVGKVGENLVSLKSQGFVDLESVPEEKRAQMDETAMNEEQVKKENDLPNHPPVVPISGVTNPAMMPGGGMPVMMRPTFPFPGMNPAMRQFVPPQRMPGFQLPPSMQNPTSAPPAPPSPPKPEESKTPTQDEKLDGAQKAAAVAASIMSSVQQRMPQPVMSVAQRFPTGAPMPMEIRMVPGMHGPSPMMPPHRIGMVPIRMGLPMQIRPGFARVPVPQGMVRFQPALPRMGQMLPRGPVPVMGARMQGPPAPQDEPMLDGSKSDLELEKKDEETPAERPNEGLGPLRPPLGCHPMDDHILMGERPPLMDRMVMGQRPPMGDRMRPLGGRPPLHPMEERPPFGFRRSPPGRFGFERRLPMNGPDGPRFMGRERFMDRGMGDHRRGDMRRRSPERSRERERFDRGMRERRFDDRRGFGDWGRDRGRFGDREDMHGRGRGRGFGDRPRDRDRDQEGDDAPSFGHGDEEGKDESRDHDDDRRRERGRRDDRDHRDRRRDDRDRDRRRDRRRSRDRDRRDDRRDREDNKRRKVEDSDANADSKDCSAVKQEDSAKSNPDHLKHEDHTSEVKLGMDVKVEPTVVKTESTVVKTDSNVATTTEPTEVKVESDATVKIEPFEVKADSDIQAKETHSSIVQGEPPVAAPDNVDSTAIEDSKPLDLETLQATHDTLVEAPAHQI